MTDSEDWLETNSEIDTLNIAVEMLRFIDGLLEVVLLPFLVQV